MSKNLSLTIAAAVVILGSSLPAMASYEGCAPGFWKNHPSAIIEAGYNPDFMIPILSLGGGDVSALLRHEAAAVLNAAHPDIPYPVSVCWIVDNVERVLASGDPCAIKSLKEQLDAWNNLGCDW